MSFSDFRRIRVDQWPLSGLCGDAGKRWCGAEASRPVVSHSTSALTQRAGRVSLKPKGGARRRVHLLEAFLNKDKFVRLCATKAARIPRHEMDSRSNKTPDRCIFAKTCVRLRTDYPR